MTSKDANLRFLDELQASGALNVEHEEQVQRQREQYNQTDRFETILAYGQVNQGIQTRVANNYGTSLFPLSRTIVNPYFQQPLAPQYPLAPYPPFMYNPYVSIYPYSMPFYQPVAVPVPVPVPVPVQVIPPAPIPAPAQISTVNPAPIPAPAPFQVVSPAPSPYPLQQMTPSIPVQPQPIYQPAPQVPQLFNPNQVQIQQPSPVPLNGYSTVQMPNVYNSNLQNGYATTQQNQNYMTGFRQY